MSVCMFTCWAVEQHLQWGQASITAVHCEGLWDMSSHSIAQAWASTPHLTGINQLSDWNPERTACMVETLHMLKNTILNNN